MPGVAGWPWCCCGVVDHGVAGGVVDMALPGVAVVTMVLLWWTMVLLW